MNNKVAIRRLATGVPGLDAILGGGLPEFSINLVLGAPGSGKTTLAHQIMFALATPERPALFFTMFGETPLKMLRYQQQFSFFDLDKINDSIRFVNLSDDDAMSSFDQILARIIQEIEGFAPALCFFDSFRSVILEAKNQANNTISLQQFIQQLGIHLSSWQVTSFLSGVYPSKDEPHPIFTLADGLLY